MATKSAHTEVPAGAAPGFPPFQFETFPSQLLWLAITFVILYVLTAKVTLPRIGGILEARAKRIADDVADATRLRDQSNAAVAAYEKALADAHSRAQAMTNEARAKQAAEAEDVRKRLAVTLKARVAEAEKAIASTKETAVADGRTTAADLAGTIVERLVGVSPLAAARDLRGVHQDQALRRR
jgi:F-type H+-transporting ATPase subunit b